MLRAARQGLAGRRPLMWAAWYGGVAAVGAGGLFAFDGNWTVAAPLCVAGALLLWLTGAWVRPGGPEAYARRVLHVLGDWAAYENASDGGYEHRLRKSERRLAELTPPDELRADHERLVALIAEPVAVWADGVDAPAERVRREIAARAATQELLESIRARAPGSPYVSELDRLRTAMREQYLEAAPDADRATADAADRLERITPPPGFEIDHTAMVTALRDVHTAAVDLRTAREAFDTDRAVAAMEAWEAATARVQDHAQRISDRAA